MADAANTPTTEEQHQGAINFLEAQAYLPVFEQKLAARGYVPENEEQRQLFYELGWRERMLADEKRANAQSPQAQLLKLASNRHGLDAQAHREQRANVAFNVVMSDPKIAAAAAILASLGD